MRNFKFAATVAIIAALASQIPALAEDKPDAVIAKVGDIEIKQSELDLAIANLDPQLAQLPDDKKKIAALSAAIDVNVVTGLANKEKLADTADFKTRMNFLMTRELHNAYFKKFVLDTVTPEDIKARYDKEVAAMPPTDEVKAAHILVKTEEEAKAIIADLDAGKDFAELAKEKSADPSKSEGGDLGYFSKGRMVPEFETAAFALNVGEYTKVPVKSQFGFHVIKLLDKRVAPPPPFDQVSQQVRQLVMQDKYIAMLKAAKADTTIEIVDPALKAGYDAANAPAK
jgi:peptidyl-prolyl cis-trans isomerase C